MSAPTLLLQPHRAGLPAGRGRAAYAESATDLLDPFLEEFDLLANLFARKLALTVQAHAGGHSRRCPGPCCNGFLRLAEAVIHGFTFAAWTLGPSARPQPASPEDRLRSQAA